MYRGFTYKHWYRDRRYHFIIYSRPNVSTENLHSHIILFELGNGRINYYAVELIINVFQLIIETFEIIIQIFQLIMHTFQLLIYTYQDPN